MVERKVDSANIHNPCVVGQNFDSPNIHKEGEAVGLRQRVRFYRIRLESRRSIYRM